LQLALAKLEKTEIVRREIHPVRNRGLVDIENDRQLLVGRGSRASLLDKGFCIVQHPDNVAVIGAKAFVIDQLQFEDAEIRRLRSVG
jgi:hypothetical protein